MFYIFNAIRVLKKADGVSEAISDGWSVKLWGDTKKDAINKFREMAGMEQRFTCNEE